MTDKPKRGVGAPRKEIDYDKVEALAARGMTKNNIAHCIGISPATLQSRQKDDKKFMLAIERGTSAGIAAVTGQLLKQINLGNMTGIIFYLKCVGKWKETTLIGEDPENPLPKPDVAAALREITKEYLAEQDAELEKAY